MHYQMPQQFIISPQWSDSTAADQLHASTSSTRRPSTPHTLPSTEYMQHGAPQQPVQVDEAMPLSEHESGVSVSSFYFPEEQDDAPAGVHHVIPPGGSPNVSPPAPPAPPATAAVSAASSEARWSQGEDAYVHAAVRQGAAMPQLQPIRERANLPSHHGAIGGRKCPRRVSSPRLSPADGCHDSRSAEHAPHECTHECLAESPRKRPATPRSKLALRKQRRTQHVHCTQPRAFAAALSDALEAAALRDDDAGANSRSAHAPCRHDTVSASGQAPSVAAATAVHALLSLSKARR